MRTLIVTGTDTGLGKTVVCAMLMLALDGSYWKPIQAGTEGGTDTERVAALTGLPPTRFVPERYVLRSALSPHRAAELDGITIDPQSLDPPASGGGLVPITRASLQVELLSHWRAPVVVVARTALGTINHTLLTLEALRLRTIAILGIVFVGDAVADTERTIGEFGAVKILGRLPLLPILDAVHLRAAFQSNFNVRDFETADAR